MLYLAAENGGRASGSALPGSSLVTSNKLYCVVEQAEKPVHIFVEQAEKPVHIFATGKMPVPQLIT